MGAGLYAFVTPGLAMVKLGNQQQELAGGCIDMGGEFGEVVCQILRGQSSDVNHDFLRICMLVEPGVHGTATDDEDPQICPFVTIIPRFENTQEKSLLRSWVGTGLSEGVNISVTKHKKT